MTDQELLQQLDSRAASAAADVHARAAARSVPPFGADRSLAPPAPTPIRSRLALEPRRLAAAAAILLLVVGVVGWAVLNRHDDGADPPAVHTGEGLLPYVATDLPDGVALGGAFHVDGVDAGPRGRGEQPIPVSFYGPPDGEPQVAVAPAERLGLGNDQLGRPIDLGGGRNAQTVHGSSFGVTAVRVTGPVGLADSVVLTSRLLDEGELRELGRGTSVADDGHAVLAPGSSPDGWVLLVTEPDLVAAINPLGGMGGSGEVYGTYYADEAGPEQASTKTVSVFSMPGGPARLATAKVLLDEVHEVEVRGHPALAGAVPGDGETPTLRLVAWVDAPGTLIRVAGTGLGEAELVAAAQGVEPTTRTAFDELVRRTQLGELDGPAIDDRPVIGRGSFADGSTWVLRVDGSDGGVAVSTALAVALADAGTSGGDSSSGGSGSGPGSSADVAFRSVDTLDPGGRHFASGLLGGDVVAVELRRPGGAVIGQAEVVDGAGVRAWVAELTESPTVVVALGSRSEELGRTTLGTGDGGEVDGQGSSLDPATPTTVGG